MSGYIWIVRGGLRKPTAKSLGFDIKPAIETARNRLELAGDR